MSACRRSRIAAVVAATLLPVVGLAATDVLVNLGGNEPTAAAVNPLAPANVAVAQFLQIRLSTDYGRTFPTLANMNANPPVYGTIATWGGCGDASVAFDSQGRLFMTYLLCGNDNAAPSNRVDISGFAQQVNPTTGALIGNAVEFTGANQLNNDDKSWLAADANATSPYHDNLYVVWTRLGSPSRVMFSRSTNQGATWSTPTAIDAGTEGFVWPSHVAVAPNGDVYVTYHGDTCGAANANVFVLRDTQGGQQFQNGAGFQKTSFASAVTCNRQANPGTIPNTVFWMQGASQAFVLPDPIRPGNVYVVANDDPNDDFTTGDGADVVLAKSTDYGLTWNVKTVSHAPVGTAQVFPTGATDQLGNLVVTWWDTRRGLTNAAGDFLLDQYATVSRDGGNTFTFDVRVSDFAFDPDLNAACRFGPANCGTNGDAVRTLRIGEYNGTAAADGAAYMIWTGNSGTNPPSGNQTTYFDAFSILGAFPDALEPNDAFNPGVASVLGADRTYTVAGLTIHSDTDEDWFKVVALDTGKLTFSITYNSRLSDLDIEVHDKLNNAIVASTPGLDTNDVETITIPAVAGEAYYLRVYAEPNQVPPINTYALSIVNTAVPVPQNLVLAPGSDTGVSGTDNITNQSKPTILLSLDLGPLAGLAFSPDDASPALEDDTPGYKVEVYANGIVAGRATPVPSQPGIFSYTFTSALPEGQDFITARVVIVDNSGGSAPGTLHSTGIGALSSALVVTIDTTPPDASALGLLDLLASSDTGGVDDDNITTFSTPSFSLQVNTTGFVRVYAQRLTGTTPLPAALQVAQFLVTNPNVWQFTVSSLADGVYAITATIEDTAGNVGPPTVPLKITVAKSALTLPGQTVLAAGSAVVIDLAAKTISGFNSASTTHLIGIAGIPTVNVDVNGQRLTVNLTAGDDALGYTPSGPAAGSVSLAGVAQTINFTGSGVFVVNPLGGTDTVTTYGTAAGDTVNMTVDTMISVRVGTTCALNVPAAQIEKVAVSTLQGNDTVNVSIFDTVNAAVFVDGGDPTTVNKGNDALNLIDMTGRGLYSNISGGGTPGAGAVSLKYPKTTGNSTRVDYVGIEKLTRR